MDSEGLSFSEDLRDCCVENSGWLLRQKDSEGSCVEKYLRGCHVKKYQKSCVVRQIPMASVF